MKRDIQDLLDELEDSAWNREEYKVMAARARIDEWLVNRLEEEKGDIMCWVDEYLDLPSDLVEMFVDHIEAYEG